MLETSLWVGNTPVRLPQVGESKCWGDNDQGQLGNGNTTDSLAPVDVSGLTSGVTAIGAGHKHLCAYHKWGSQMLGDNDQGQLGNGNTTDSSTPVDVSGLTGVIAISADHKHTCAVNANGEVKCWGNGHTTNHDVTTKADATKS